MDSSNQFLMVLFMALSPEDVSSIKLGKLAPYTCVLLCCPSSVDVRLNQLRFRGPLPRIEMLRHLRDFFGIKFKVDPDPVTKTVQLACLGVGYINYSKAGI